MRPARRIAVVLAVGVGLGSTGCRKEPTYAKTTFYERRIEPILSESCANSPTQSGCHVAADDRGNAFGNLNVTSYSTFTKRKDLLVSYGPYGMPGLLAKVLPGFQIRLSTWDRTDPIVITTDIQHAGGSLIDITSTSFNTLSSWIQRGATENNSLPPPKDLGRTPCSKAVGTDALFDPSADPAAKDFATFSSKVNPVLGSTCAAGNCHGSPGNSLYLTCGETPEQVRWNYFVASDYVSADVESSELLRRTVAQSAGGVYHEGGTLFQSTADSGYRAILQWATEKGGPEPSHIPQNAGFQFFTRAVQPMLVKRGCLLLGCHSPAMGHDYRLRSGSAGHFGLPSTRHNYQLTLDQLALDSPDPNTSRILRKNLEPFVAGGAAPQIPLGILHRGGALFGRGNDACPTDETAFDPATLDAQDPYCVIRHFIEIERTDRMATAAPLSAIVYVKRPPRTDPEPPQGFETFSPGGDLMRSTVTAVAADGTLTVDAGTSLLAGCGLAAGIDVRRPEVSWDGSEIAFSARASATEPYRVYVIGPTGCAVEPTIDAAPSTGNNGELVHNFDPVFAPDGSIVFASTRGNVMNVTSFDYQGPQRTPADPSRSNANLYVLEHRTDAPAIRQLTFLLNQEMSPSFMGDGRLIMTTEKRAKGFYQLAGRRENLDGGDYHPLFGQRATIGFHQVTDIVELADKNFAAIFSEPGAAHSAGALGVVNRSLGVDQQSQNADDYTQDAKAKDWPNPRFYQHGVRILDGVGKPGESGNVYRNPSRLPSGGVLVAMAPAVPDAGNFSTPFHLVVVNPVTAAVTDVLSDAANDLVWPAAVYARFDRGVYRSKLDEPNGSTHVSSDPDAQAVSDITILDAPLLESLLFQNTRSRRFIPAPSPIGVWEDLPPEASVKSFADGGSFVVDDAFGKVYVRRRQLGSATPENDGSVHLQVPGGAPIVLAPSVQLAGDSGQATHHQLEEMQFYPGEVVRQGFRRDFFNGVCASCHGAISGYDADIAANPDILTQASRVEAMGTSPRKLDSKGPPSGPPFP